MTFATESIVRSCTAQSLIDSPSARCCSHERGPPGRCLFQNQKHHR